ncbi:MAG: M23 family metallopeptidase [Desulfobulbaceae bacterium]|nr:M23 family metallopeptidase [Desulfobulbaceae bacterium]
MHALKKFLASFHFITITVFCSLTMILFVVLTDLPSNKSLKDAKASVSPSLDSTRLSPLESFSKDTNDESFEIRGELLAGDTLSKSFQRHKVPPQTSSLVFEYLKQAIDFKKLRPGDRYSIRIDGNNELLRCVYKISALESYTIKYTDNGYRVERDKKFLETRKIRISGEVNTTLFNAFPDNIKTPRLVYSFADIFSSRIDFNTETKIGDSFDLIVEEYYLFGDFIGYGPIMAGKYERTNGELFEAFKYSPGKDLSGYFDRNGNELGASFLRSPVRIGRVSSRFSWRRKHPILGVVRQHLGVDLAAPYGTPIMAAADGKIVSLGTNGGFGKQIIIAHGNDYRTHYGHLSRFKKGLKTGSRVKQKQIIGYVGSTGLSTGPHLDYRVQHHGIFKNPFSVKYRPKSTLKENELAGLNDSISSLIPELYLDSSHSILAISSLTLEKDQQLTLL